MAATPWTQLLVPAVAENGTMIGTIAPFDGELTTTFAKAATGLKARARRGRTKIVFKGGYGGATSY
jgi:hypothetical protein